VACVADRDHLGRVKAVFETGATGLEPATSSVTGRIGSSGLTPLGRVFSAKQVVLHIVLRGLPCAAGATANFSRDVRGMSYLSLRRRPAPQTK